MKIQALLLGAAIATLACTSHASSAQLSPRAAGNQIRVVDGQAAPVPAAVAYVHSHSALLSPRAAGNQINVVAGIARETNPALVCRATMNGTPKAVTECSSHANMPGCMAAAR